MRKLKFFICTLLLISIFAGAGVIAFAHKMAADLSKSQKEADEIIAVDAWMEGQGTSVLNELRKSVDNWKERMSEANEAGDTETAEKCAGIISTQEKLISELEEYINSSQFIEHVNALSEEDMVYIDILQELLNNEQE